MQAGLLVKLSHLGTGEQLFSWLWIGEVTYEIAGAICAPTANTLPVVHIVVKAHWVDLLGDGDVIDEEDGDSS